ncbi:MAG TPA: TlpA disulfide reductase family protein [Acidobacteriaceae bacterium]
MARRALLVLIMIGGIGLVVWSGVRNFRQRRLNAEHRQQMQAVLVHTPETDPNTPSPLLGKPAPDFTLVDLAGKKVSLKDFKGHPLLLNFWGTYCDPCKIEMPWLEEFHKKYAGQGFEVVGVTYDSEVGNAVITKSTHQLGVTYPILLSDPKAEKDYLSDSEVLPMSFYVDREGKIIQVTAGLGGKDQLEAMVKKTIASNN